jgi:cellulose synthase/poly-beta-1,6-N-acetylglucosamine synthase-like glycosyltransferase
MSSLHLHFPPAIGTILFWLMSTTFLIQLIIYIFIYLRFAFHKPKIAGHEHKPVSVIICAKNELENLRKNIYAVLGQSYHEFEVIVVNDCSWDETEYFLKELKEQYKNLKVVTITEQKDYRRGKKLAVTLGIKAASYEHLLFTDADCKPAGKNWLTNMQNNFADGKEIVLGYGAFEKQKGFLNKIIRADAYMIALRYLSAALSGIPYMGVGRNLAYTKSLFFNNKGFASHNHLLSGDDDLFVNETATSRNVAIEVQKQAFTYTAPKTTFSGWFRQKARHLSTAKHYKISRKLFLTAEALSTFFFFATLILWLAAGYDWKIAVAFFSIRFSVQLIVNIKSAVKLDEKDLIAFIPFIEIILLFVYPFIYLSSLQKNIAWK